MPKSTPNTFTGNRLAAIVGAIILFGFGSFFLYTIIKLFGPVRSVADLFAFASMALLVLGLYSGSWQLLKVGMSPDKNINLSPEQQQTKQLKDIVAFNKFRYSWAGAIILCYLIYSFLAR